MALRDLWRRQNLELQLHGFKAQTEPEWVLDPAEQAEREARREAELDRLHAEYEAQQAKNRCPDSGRKFPGRL